MILFSHATMKKVNDSSYNFNSRLQICFKYIAFHLQVHVLNMKLTHLITCCESLYNYSNINIVWLKLLPGIKWKNKTIEVVISIQSRTGLSAGKESYDDKLRP